MLAQEVAASQDKIITADDYCEFLNKTASRDELHLYDWKLATELESPCIRRSGAPGSYCYKATDCQATGSEKNAALPMLHFLERPQNKINECCCRFFKN